MTDEELAAKFSACSMVRGGIKYDDIKFFVRKIIREEVAAAYWDAAKIADDAGSWCRSFGAEETAAHIAGAIRSRVKKMEAEARERLGRMEDDLGIE